MFKKKKLLFVTIEFADVSGVFDYPKHLPLPRIDDEIHFKEMYGKVLGVKHMTQGNVTDIRIQCTNIKNHKISWYEEQVEKMRTQFKAEAKKFIPEISELETLLEGKLKDNLAKGYHYLNTVLPSELTIENTLKAFGFNSSNEKYDDYIFQKIWDVHMEELESRTRGFTIRENDF